MARKSVSIKPVSVQLQVNTSKAGKLYTTLYIKLSDGQEYKMFLQDSKYKKDFQEVNMYQVDKYIKTLEEFKR